MSKLLKQMMFAEYEKLVDGRDSLLFVEHDKFAAEEVRALRNNLREQNIEMVVVKNRVFDKVLEKHGINGFRNITDGSTAVLTSSDDGAAQKAAKVLDKWHKGGKETAAIVGGMMEGAISGPDEAKTWKDLPTREEALSILVGQIIGVGSKLSSQLIGPGSALASQLVARGEGEGNPPAAAE